MDLDRTLAFTALLDMDPGFRRMTVDESQPVIRELAVAMTEANPKDRWAFAKAHIGDRLAAEALAAEDQAGPRGPGYLLPQRSRLDYRMALAIARSAHPSRVLANTGGYRYGRFEERGWAVDDGTAQPPVVTVTMMGNRIAVFRPEGAELSSCEYRTTSTSEALSNLVTGGYFYQHKGKLIFSRFDTTRDCPDCGCSHREGHPARDGQLYPYV